jgi:hypothetical protein
MDYLDRADDSHNGDEFESSALIAGATMDAEYIIRTVGNDAVRQGRSKAFIAGAKVGAEVAALTVSGESCQYAKGTAHYDAWESGYRCGWVSAKALMQGEAA